MMTLTPFIRCYDIKLYNMKKIIYLLFLTSFLQANAQTGIPVPQMTAADNLVKNFMTANGVPGLTIASGERRKNCLHAWLWLCRYC